MFGGFADLAFLGFARCALGSLTRLFLRSLQRLRLCQHTCLLGGLRRVFRRAQPDPPARGESPQRRAAWAASASAACAAAISRAARSSRSRNTWRARLAAPLFLARVGHLLEIVAIREPIDGRRPPCP